jgi:hypothetical protein
MCGLFESDLVTTEGIRATVPWVLAGEPEPIVYRSVVGEFHKLGNLEERGLYLPEVESYYSVQSTVSIKKRPRRKLGDIVGDKIYIGPPSAACLEAVKRWKNSQKMDETYYNVLLK